MTPPPPRGCMVPDCRYVTPTNLPTYEHQFTDLKLHFSMAHNEMAAQQQPAGAGAQQEAGTAVGPGTARREKPRRPKIMSDITDSDWVWFEERWARYKRATQLSGSSVTDELWDCADDELARRVYESGATTDITEADLLAALKKFAIRTQNKLCNVVEFMNMSQQPEEAVSNYISRLRGQAKVCDFSVKCTATGCTAEVSYTDKMVSHQLVRGLADTQTQERVLSLAATEKKLDLEEITKFVEGQETGLRSSKVLNSAAISKVSDYQRHRSNTLPGRLPTNNSGGGDNNAKCIWCGHTGHGARANQETRAAKCRAWGKSCQKCTRLNHFASVCKSSRPPGATNNVDSAQGNMDSDTGEVYLHNSTSLPTRPRHKRAGIRVLSHMAVNEYGKWSPATPEPHSSIKVTISLSTSSYQELNIPTPHHHHSTEHTALPDSGAQVTVGGIEMIHRMGLKKHNLIPVSQRVSGANNNSLQLLGGVFIDVSATSNTGETVTTRELCYIADGVRRLLLSKRTCINLGILSNRFPTIDNTVDTVTVNECQNIDPEDPDKCQCPPREETPPAPASIPFPPTEENIPKLKQWILDHYSTSAFLCCKNQPLPMVNTTPTMKLYVDPEAKPKAFHKPYPVPVHWKADIKAGLDADVKLGVIEKVPIGEETKWCSRMVCVAKKNGKPRRTVDLKHLNDACARQTNPVKSPFHQAISVPPGTWRTCLDAWNGFHSIPLEEDQRHLCTFVTEWGKYRYKSLPQGFLAATDGYTERYDFITKDISRMERCVDDTVLWDTTIEENFHSTCRYLSICASAGILFTEKKFQFCSKKVEFLGFDLDEEGVKPSEEFLKAIRDFPAPRDITGVRSWFGLVEQSSYTFSKTSVMEPFRHLLKPSTKFAWTEE